jgi:hypothetical protein
MSKTEIQKCPFNKAQLLRVLDLIGGDGHSIYNKCGLAEELGVPDKMLDQYTRDYTSSTTDPKHMITKADGSLAEHMVGVYGLDMLKKIARQLDVEIPDMMGRGFLARALTSNLEAHVNKMPD